MMKRELRQIKEEVEDIRGMLEGSGEETESLRKAADALLSVLKQDRLTKEANQREELAIAIAEFAEWQNGDYDVDCDTKSVISRTLWYTVSDHVRDITQRTPPLPRSS